jgi:hypothetical protein
VVGSISPQRRTVACARSTVGIAIMALAAAEPARKPRFVSLVIVFSSLSGRFSGSLFRRLVSIGA